MSADARIWEHFGRADPLWAVHTSPPGDVWAEDAFLATGVREVEDVFAALEAWGIDVPPGRALDFGCGVGRLTLALAPRFEAVVGVDLSAAMLDVARRLALGQGHVRYRQRGAPGELVAERGEFDFVLSLIALQHVSSRAAVVAYLAALAAALRPGGVGVIQLPAHTALRVRLHPVRLLGRVAPGVVLRGPRRLRSHVMSLTAVPEPAVVAVFAAAGLEVLHVVEDGRAGSDRVRSLAYVVRRPG